MVAEASATGRNATRAGNADPHFVLHGVFPAAGEGRWIAIAARTQAEWGAAARVLQAQGFTKVVNLKGGLQAWRGENLPLVKPGAKGK